MPCHSSGLAASPALKDGHHFIWSNSDFLSLLSGKSNKISKILTIPFTYYDVRKVFLLSKNVFMSSVCSGPISCYPGYSERLKSLASLLN